MTVMIFDDSGSLKPLIPDTTGTMVINNVDTLKSNAKIQNVGQQALDKAIEPATKKSLLGKIVEKVKGSKKVRIDEKQEDKSPPKHAPLTNNRFQPLPILVKKRHSPEKKIPKEFILPGQKVYNTPEFILNSKTTQSGNHDFIEAQMFPIGDFPIVSKKIANPNKKPNPFAEVKVAEEDKLPVENPGEALAEPAANQTGTVVYKVNTDVTPPIPVEIRPEAVQTPKTINKPIVQADQPVLKPTKQTTTLETTKQPNVLTANPEKTKNTVALVDKSVQKAPTISQTQPILIQSVKKSLFSRFCDKIQQIATSIFTGLVRIKDAAVSWFTPLKTKPQQIAVKPPLLVKTTKG